jgi:hypothetical protein
MHWQTSKGFVAAERVEEYMVLLGESMLGPMCPTGPFDWLLASSKFDIMSNTPLFHYTIPFDFHDKLIVAVAGHSPSTPPASARKCCKKSLS